MHIKLAFCLELFICSFLQPLFHILTRITDLTENRERKNRGRCVLLSGLGFSSSWLDQLERM